MRATAQLLVALVAVGLVLTGIWWVFPAAALITGGLLLLVGLYIEAYLNHTIPTNGTR